jgi:hypothetical protein
VITYPDRREEPQSVRYQAVTFDSGPGPYTATPLAGSISAEWTSADYDTGVYTTQAATVVPVIGVKSAHLPASQHRG